MSLTNEELRERAEALENGCTLHDGAACWDCGSACRECVEETLRSVRDEAEVEGARTAANIWLEIFFKYAPNFVEGLRSRDSLRRSDMESLIDAVREEARSEVLEEAAKVIDGDSCAGPDDKCGHPTCDLMNAQATRIRALKSNP